MYFVCVVQFYVMCVFLYVNVCIQNAFRGTATGASGPAVETPKIKREAPRTSVSRATPNKRSSPIDHNYPPRVLRDRKSGSESGLLLSLLLHVCMYDVCMSTTQHTDTFVTT